MTCASAGEKAAYPIIGGVAIFDERKSQMVELRFFGSLSIKETVGVLGVSPGLGVRDRTLAKTWLQREINRGGPDAV